MATMNAQWANEKEAIHHLSDLRRELEQTHQLVEKAEREYDLNKAAELKYGRLPQLEAQLREEEKRIREGEAKATLLREEVDEEEIARIISRWTGIPLARLVEGEREKLLHLDETLHKRVIGQNEAVERVADAILRARAGIRDPRRPIGSFLFLGPTGVGKTELAKTLAISLFDTEKNLVRIDMSEYMEKHAVSRLIGAPPGYVGYDEGGQLTEAVRRKPYSVVLLDEVEKAHPDVFHVLLQVLDDGRITDSQGRTVDFKNTLVIMTSNIGSSYLLEGIDPSGHVSESAQQAVMGELRRHFRPEFLNRLDDIVFFKPLTESEIGQIVGLMVDELRDRLAERRIAIRLMPGAVERIVQEGYDPVYGARPLRRYIQRHLETLIARMLIGGGIPDGATVTVDTKRNGETGLEELDVTWGMPPG